MGLGKRLGHSTIWMSTAASINSICSFLIFIVLSRILSPEEIGLVAFALIVVETGKVVVNAGFPQAIVQNQLWDETTASTCFYLNMTFALTVAVVISLLGAPLASHYYDPAAGPLLQVLSAIFFLEGVKAVHEGKLKREFAFQTIAVRTVIGGAIAGATGIYLALEGYGVWALVGQQLVHHIVVTLITLVSASWRPRLTFSHDDCKQLLRFSTPLLLAQLVGNLSSRIFEIVIGLLIGPASLGFFRVGGRALFILQESILKPFEQPLLSALSRISSRAQQAEGTLRIIRMSACLTLPVFFGAASAGPDFIILAFGPKWEFSGSIMTILALGTAPLIIDYQIHAALTASGNPRLVMALACIVCGINCCLALLTVPFGLFAAACGFAIRSYLTIFFSLFFFRKIFDIGIISIMKVVYPAFISSTVMFGVIAIFKLSMADRIAPALSLALTCLMGLVVYVFLMTIFFREETDNIFREGASLMLKQS